MKSGTLIVRPISAKLLRNTELFGNMSPYVKVILGDLYEKSPVAKKQNIDPSWQCELSFKLTNQQDLIIEIWNHHTLRKDDFLGSVSVTLSEWMGNGTRFSEWIPIFYQEQDAGALKLEMEFIPDAMTVPTQNTMITETSTLQQQYSQGQESYPNAMPVTSQNTLIAESSTVQTRQPLIYSSQQQGYSSQQQYPQGQESYREEVAVQNAQPKIYYGQPTVHVKKIVTVKPTIYEQDIIYKEFPVTIEKPQLIETTIHHQEPLQVIRNNEVVYQEPQNPEIKKPELVDANIHLERVVQTAQPTVIQDRSEIHERNIIQEKPIIHEQSIVYTQQEVIQEKPEFIQQRIFHQEPTIVKTEPLLYEKREEHAP
jgi:hypothetical protein